MTAIRPATAAARQELFRRYREIVKDGSIAEIFILLQEAEKSVGTTREVTENFKLLTSLKYQNILRQVASSARKLPPPILRYLVENGDTGVVQTLSSTPHMFSPALHANIGYRLLGIPVKEDFTDRSDGALVQVALASKVTNRTRAFEDPRMPQHLLRLATALAVVDGKHERGNALSGFPSATLGAHLILNKRLPVPAKAILTPWTMVGFPEYAWLRDYKQWEQARTVDGNRLEAPELSNRVAAWVEENTPQLSGLPARMVLTALRKVPVTDPAWNVEHKVAWPKNSEWEKN